MPTTIVITCPECNKQMKAPATVQGKTVRCKGCGHTFPARAPAGGAIKPAGKATAPAKTKPDPKAKAPAKPAKPAKAKDDDDEYENPNPYGITHLDLTPRCSNCAGELESADDVICLHCGFNLMTRELNRTQKTYDRTGKDWFLWLMPGVLCVFAVFVLIGVIVFLFVWAKGLLEAYPDEWWNFGVEATRLWGLVFCLFLIFFAARFAIKRLIINYMPPEKEKQ